MAKRRAKAGGEIGKNGEFYPGGTFLPSTHLPKQGSQGRKAGSGLCLVAPGERAMVPEGRRAIYATIHQYVIPLPSGLVRKYHEDHPASQYLGPEGNAWLDRLIAEFNRGMRHLPISQVEG